MKFLTRKGFLIEEQGMTHLCETDQARPTQQYRLQNCIEPPILFPQSQKGCHKPVSCSGMVP